MDFVEENFPVESGSTFIRNRLDLQETKIKNKSRSSTRLDLKNISPPVRNKTDSESSDKDIVLNIIETKMNDVKVCISSSVECILIAFSLIVTCAYFINVIYCHQISVTNM